jgi:hypothetical protein
MASARSVGNVQTALAERLYPSVSVWNRLEGRPRTVAFDRALRAEVGDPLWMLTKQWQMGEFRGADAGSPIFARLMLETTQLTKYRPNGQGAEVFPTDIPLEVKVERREPALDLGGHPVALDLRLTMGRYWLKLIRTLPNNYASDFVLAYPVLKPNPTDPVQADRCAHVEAWQIYEAAAGRAMDGGALYEYLTANAANHTYDNIAAIAASDYAALDALGKGFVTWFQRLISMPSAGSDDAWVPNRLEYQFAVSAPDQNGTEKVYVADEYYQGRLDWYSLDIDAADDTLGTVTGATPPPTSLSVRTMVPTAVSFSGMPNTRWWSFEERATNFGDIDASTTDAAKLLFMEFALVYSNDWFVIPYTLPVGSIATVDGMAVTNVFGERLWITAAGSGADANWQRWSLFTINVQSGGAAASDTSLLLLPTVPYIQEGELLEDVLLIRDETANMVWGIEKTVSLSTGEPKRGLEVAREELAYFEGIVTNAGGGGGAPPPPRPAPIRYQLMTSVPENWIPFVPVHVSPGDNREVQLQRAAMPRIIGGDPTALPPTLRKVKPRTVLLREGLDAAIPAPYFVFEEEVPRAGARVCQRYERTRWIGGAVQVWLRARKERGRGEGSSGLAFDTLQPSSST